MKELCKSILEVVEQVATYSYKISELQRLTEQVTDPELRHHCEEVLKWWIWYVPPEYERSPIDPRMGLYNPEVPRTHKQWLLGVSVAYMNLKKCCQKFMS